VLWVGDYSTKVRWTLTVVVVGAALGFAAAARERVMRPLQTLANLLAALREDDFSIRGRHDRLDDALGTAMAEVNALGDTLKAQRLGAVEAAALLRKVLEAIDVAILAFDEAGVLRLINRAGERLLGAGQWLGQDAPALTCAPRMRPFRTRSAGRRTSPWVRPVRPVAVRRRRQGGSPRHRRGSPAR